MTTGRVRVRGSPGGGGGLRCRQVSAAADRAGPGAGCRQRAVLRPGTFAKNEIERVLAVFDMEKLAIEPLLLQARRIISTSQGCPRPGGRGCVREERSHGEASGREKQNVAPGQAPLRPDAAAVRRMIRWTRARPTPLPSNSRRLCRRWKTPKSCQRAADRSRRRCRARSIDLAAVFAGADSITALSRGW